MAEKPDINLRADQAMVGENNTMIIQPGPQVHLHITIQTPGADTSGCNSGFSHDQQGQGQGQSPQGQGQSSQGQGQSSQGQGQSNQGQPQPQPQDQQRRTVPLEQQVSEDCPKERSETPVASGQNTRPVPMPSRQQSVPSGSSLPYSLNPSVPQERAHPKVASSVSAPTATSSELQARCKPLAETISGDGNRRQPALPYSLNPRQCPKSGNNDQAEMTQILPQKMPDTKVQLETVATNISSDKKVPDLSGIITAKLMSVLVLVVTDFANRCLKVISPKGKAKTRSLTLPEEPVSLSALGGNNKCIVSYLTLCRFSIIVISELKVESVVNTEKLYTGVAPLEENRLVASCHQSRSVDVLDHGGRILNTFTTTTFPSPSAISVMSYIYITDWMSNKLACLTKDGGIVFTVGIQSPRDSRRRLREPLQSGRSILIPDEELHQILDVGIDGKAATIVLEGKHGINRPKALCKEGSKLYIAEAGGGIKIWETDKSHNTHNTRL